VLPEDLRDIFRSLKVVELAAVLAGPSVGMFLAELGSQVIKFENKKTGGDVTRSWKLPSEDQSSQVSAYFSSVNWGKRHKFVDFSVESDYEFVIQSIEQADIVISNFLPRIAKKWSLDFDSVRKRNNKLIYAQVSAYGLESNRPGFDAIIQAESGYMSMNGEKDGNPVKMPVALMDILAAHQLKQGILLALLRRQTSGKGSFVHVSLLDSAISSLTNQASNYLMAGYVPQRMGSSHPNIAPYGDLIRSEEEDYILLAVGSDEQFANLCESLGIPSLARSENYSTNHSRVSNRPSLISHLNKASGTMRTDDITRLFSVNKVPFGLVKNLDEVLGDRPSVKRLLLETKGENGACSICLRSVVFDII
jgi:crotonobetainyl-CoA:carnitine CoA-transferase CaiB-like acyl-CoA transferase